MDKEVSYENDITKRLSKLQIRRRSAIAELENIENEINSVLKRQKEDTRKVHAPRSAKLNAISTEQSPAIDRTGKFISPGDIVRVLTPGIYKGEVVRVIEVRHNKVSFEGTQEDKVIPSWRLSHNLLKLENKETFW